MDQKNQPPSPPSAPKPLPPPPPEAVEISLPPEMPPLILPLPTVEPDTADLEQAKRRKLVDQAQNHLASAYDALAQLGGPNAAQTDALGRAILEIVSKAADDDALLSYDIRFSNKEGEIFQFTGHNMLHSFSAQQMLSEGPRNFEALLYTVLFRPLKAQVQNYLNTFVKNDNPLSGDHTFGLNDVRPEIREAGSGSFIATSG